jgi:uncharacterized FlaG/YvyC family protein
MVKIIDEKNGEVLTTEIPPKKILDMLSSFCGVCRLVSR